MRLVALLAPVPGRSNFARRMPPITRPRYAAEMLAAV